MSYRELEWPQANRLKVGQRLYLEAEPKWVVIFVNGPSHVIVREYDLFDFWWDVLVLTHAWYQRNWVWALAGIIFGGLCLFAALWVGHGG
jgi:hypothetical protein